MKAYIEFDGHVYLDTDGDTKHLPEYSDDLRSRLNLKTRRKIKLDSEEVLYCTTMMGAGKNWPLKDDVLLDPKSDLRTQKAIIQSYPRPVVGGICLRKNDLGEEEILLLKPKRGIRMDWILPGGFIEYGEGPEDALRREVREELGVEASILSINSARTLVMDNGYSLVMILYLFDFAGEISPSEEEVSLVEWIPLDKVDFLEDIVSSL